MFYKNARIYVDGHFQTGGFEVTEDGHFGTVLSQNVPEDAVDLQGATVIPGLVDVHIHGAVGADFSDGDAKGLENMAAYLASSGVTSFAPASMTLPYETLEKAFATAHQVAKNRKAKSARVVGIHMEVPFFSMKRKGAQNGDYLKNPDYTAIRKLDDASHGMLRIVDVAPELPGAEDFIKEASKNYTISVAHTDADYEQAAMAFNTGASHLTHTYNCMNGIHHRTPGPIPAAVEQKHVRAELICDGLHIHPAAVRLAFKLFGERMVLVSDALRCCGLADGCYELGGQNVYLEGGVARLADGTLAGSATNLYDCMVNAITFGVDEELALLAATYNPACALGLQEQIGAIATGRYADFVICDSDYKNKKVYIAGKQV